MNTSSSKLPLLALVAALSACRPEPETSSTGADSASETGTTDSDSDSSTTSGDTNGDPPGMEGEGPAEHPRARQIARLTADQLYASLRVVTGQSWSDYEDYAASLGKPDLSEVTEQGRTFSISFDKFAHDAARATCRAAVDADLGEGEGQPSQPVIFRYADPSSRSHEQYVENLQYLLLRFLAIEVDDPEDPRLAPWLNLLEAPPPEGEDELDDVRMADRWWAVCVGLATHPDFLSY